MREQRRTPDIAADGRMLTNERTNQPSNQPTNKYDGSQYLLAETINNNSKKLIRPIQWRGQDLVQGGRNHVTHKNMTKYIIMQ